eukprot:XP_001691976.1 predicted protein [Chlamydomonas reinhardtii]
MGWRRHRRKSAQVGDASHQHQRSARRRGCAPRLLGTAPTSSATTAPPPPHPQHAPSHGALQHNHHTHQPHTHPFHGSAPPSPVHFLAVYLGGYLTELDAAEAYDMAALVYWGEAATLNFPKEHYDCRRAELSTLDKDGVVALLRRRSTAAVGGRGASAYRGVTRHNLAERWEARIHLGANQYLLLGEFTEETAAAAAYDYAALRRRGVHRALTNFNPATYLDPDGTSRA